MFLAPIISFWYFETSISAATHHDTHQQKINPWANTYNISQILDMVASLKAHNAVQSKVIACRLRFQPIHTEKPRQNTYTSDRIMCKEMVITIYLHCW